MRVRLIFLVLVIPIFILGCNEDFIILAPISNANEQDFYRNSDDFNNAIYGAYSTLQMSGLYRDNMQLVGDLRSDNSEMGTTASVRFPYFEMSEFRDQSTSPIVSSIWDHNYLGIKRVNTILGLIVDVDIPLSLNQRISAEARFLRGLFYFNLVRVFGDVPLVTTNILTVEEAYEYGRTPVQEVYEQIVEDLNIAIDNLPETVMGEEGRATKNAAASLLGKVYLTINQYENARDILAVVIESGQYELLDNYADLWEASNKNHRESIFDVQFQSNTAASTGAPFTVRYTPYLYPHLPFTTTGGGYNIPTEDIISAYEPNDLRRDVSVRESYIGTDGTPVTGLEGRYTIKFYDIPVQGGGSSDNWPVLRYADVLLMYAEALNEIGYQADGTAFDMLNMVRERAGLPHKTSNNSDSNLVISGQNDFRLAIEQERRVELAFEGHRWFDLVRTDRAIEVLGTKVLAGVEPYQLLLPLPLSQIEVNPDLLTQNPGYN